jgi:hypothetical protein
VYDCVPVYCCASVWLCTSLLLCQCITVPVYCCASVWMCTSLLLCQCMTVYQFIVVPVYDCVPVYCCASVWLYQFIAFYSIYGGFVTCSNSKDSDQSELLCHLIKIYTLLFLGHNNLMNQKANGVDTDKTIQILWITAISAGVKG